MRIGVISTMCGSPWGGSEELWAAMAASAIERGHEVAVSVCSPQPMPPRLAALQERGVAVSYRPAPVRRFGWIGHCLGRDWLAWRPWIRFRPEVVCVSQGSTYECVRHPACRHVVRWLKTSQIPYLVVLHGAWGTDMPSRREARLASDFFQGARAVEFVSHESLRTVQRQLAVRLSHAGIVRNPVNLSCLDPVAWPEGDCPRLACVCRLDAQVKGLDMLLEVLGQAPWRDRAWRLAVAGDGLDRRYLERLAEFYGIMERVELRGHVGDIRAFWQQHQMLLLPSRMEALPLAMVEAMLCGRPVLATDVGGIHEWLREPESGFLSEGATVRSIAATLERAYQARSAWRTIGAQAHRVAREYIDPDPGGTLLDILAGAVGGGNRPRTSKVPPVGTVGPVGTGDLR